jgi:hypothetical protein
MACARDSPALAPFPAEEPQVFARLWAGRAGAAAAGGLTADTRTALIERNSLPSLLLAVGASP